MSIIAQHPVRIRDSSGAMVTIRAGQDATQITRDPEVLRSLISSGYAVEILDDVPPPPSRAKSGSTRK